MSTASGTYNQDFNSLASTGTGHTWTDNSTITNWYSQRTGTGSLYDTNNGSVTTAGSYLFSFGSTGSSDRALGGYGSMTPGNFAHGVLLRNTSGATMTNIRVSWTLEQWRNSGVVSAHAISFWYKISSTTIIALTPNTATGWTAVTALDAAAPIMGSSPIPIGTLDGNASANKVIKTDISIPSLSLANNEYIMFKWDDPDQIGGDQSMAIDDVTIAWGSAVMPIELSQFDVQNTEGSKNLLTWQTASETQNNGFEIQRSTDGNRFEKIGFVAGKGTTTQRQDYNFNDEAQPGTTYYRLKQLDFDGRFEYSKTIAITQKGENAVSIFPNPSNGTFSITGIENLEDETFMLTNSVGQTLNLQVSDSGQFDISGLPSGLYYLRVASNGQVVKLILEFGF